MLSVLVLLAASAVLGLASPAASTPPTVTSTGTTLSETSQTGTTLTFPTVVTSASTSTVTSASSESSTPVPSTSTGTSTLSSSPSETPTITFPTSSTGTFSSTSVESSTSVSATSSASSSAPSTPSGPVRPPDGECITAAKNLGIYRFQFFPECTGLLADCLLKTANTTFIWSKTSCVAAATCGGTRYLNIIERCRTPSFPTNPNTPHLSYNVYADIVGNCAFQAGGCPITQQKFIDWLYGALSAIRSTTWPASVDAVKNNFLAPILNWTKTGNVLPYTNFDDWLRFADAQ